MTAETSDGGPCENTDRHLWPDVAKYDAPHESIHVTKEGFIGINCGGYVYTKPLSEWHKLAGGKWGMQPNVAPTSNERLNRIAQSNAIAPSGPITSDISFLLCEIERLSSETTEPLWRLARDDPHFRDAPAHVYEMHAAPGGRIWARIRSDQERNELLRIEGEHHPDLSSPRDNGHPANCGCNDCYCADFMAERRAVPRTGDA